MAASYAGLSAVFGWSAELALPGHPHRGLHTWDGRPLRAGEIVLLHWERGLTGQLRTLLATAKARGLVPALLQPASGYLPCRK